MYYFKTETNEGGFTVTEIATRIPEGALRGEWKSRWDWATLADAAEIAAAANVADAYHVGQFIAIDNGNHVSPRFDVIRLPRIGDEVSYSFNGDTYPDGKIIAISKSLKVVRTDTGSAYYRRRASGAWVKDGTWSLVRGHRDERNPSF